VKRNAKAIRPIILRLLFIETAPFNALFKGVIRIFAAGIA